MSRAGLRQRGVNLVELVIAIVIISICAVGVMLIYAQAVQYSADPMIQQQAVAIAEGYLDEILARPVNEPTALSGVAETGGSEQGNPSLASNRPLLNDVKDYSGLHNSPPQDQNGQVADLDGNSVPDLAGYVVDITVTPDVDVGGVLMAQVDVRVRYPPVVDITLTGYRAN